MSRFSSDARGNVAVIFALLAMPIIGLAGISIDFSRATDARAQLQAVSDGIALHIANSENREDFEQVLAAYLADENGAGLDTGKLAAIILDGEWLNANTFALELTGTVRTAMAHTIPGIAQAMRVNVRTEVHIDALVRQYEPPELTYLDHNAADHNQLFAYCFDYSAANPADPEARDEFRSQMTLIADNADPEVPFVWPRCLEGESLSFKLRNRRHVLAHPELLDDPNRPPYAAVFEYFTDTWIVNGRENFDIVRVVEWVPNAWRQWVSPGQIDQGFEMLETIRCNSRAECVGVSEGGIIPEGTNRTPVVEDRGCTPGAYMYFGWEDRPPGQTGPGGNWRQAAWTDRDYNDIQIVVKCPDFGELGSRNVRIIR